MRWMLMVMIVLVAGFGYTDLLTDPGFENTGGGSWAPWTSDPTFQVDFDNTSESHSGSQSLHVYWESTITGYNLFDSKQSIAVVPGQTLNASLYAKVTTPLDNMDAYLEIIYKDVSGTELDESTKLQSGHVGSSAGDWTELSTSGTVPANAATSTYRVVIFGGNPQSTSGSIYFDDATLQIPEPATAGLMSIAFGLLAVGRRMFQKKTS